MSQYGQVLMKLFIIEVDYLKNNSCNNKKTMLL